MHHIIFVKLGGKNIFQPILKPLLNLEAMKETKVEELTKFHH